MYIYIIYIYIYTCVYIYIYIYIYTHTYIKSSDFHAILRRLTSRWQIRFPGSWAPFWRRRVPCSGLNRFHSHTYLCYTILC